MILFSGLSAACPDVAESRVRCVILGSVFTAANIARAGMAVYTAVRYIRLRGMQLVTMSVPVLPREEANRAVHMVERSAAVPQIEHSRQRAGDICLRL